MRKYLPLFLALFLMLATSCKRGEKQDEPAGQKEKPSPTAPQSKAPEDGKEDGKVVARVNGKPIYEEEVRGDIEDAIERELLYQEALRRGVDRQIARELEEYKRNLVLRVFKDQMRRGTIEVDDEEVLGYYQKHKGDYQSIAVRELVTTDLDTAKEISSRIEAGEDFEKLYREYVVEGERAHHHFKVDPVYAEQFLGKEVGAVIGPIEKFGEYKVAKLTERHVEPFESARPSIERKLRRQKAKKAQRELLQKLREQSEIEIVGKEAKPGEEITFTKRDFFKLAKGCLEMPRSFARTNCIKPVFQTISFNRSAKYAITLAHDLQTEGVIADCHLMAHYIGRSELEKTNYDVESAFSACSPQCMQGCYHGVLETYVGYAKWSPEEIPLKATELCNGIARDVILKRQCIHGVGHGLVAKGYLPLEEAIGLCRKLSQDIMIHSCLGGVFMEHMNKLLSYGEEELMGVLPSLCDAVDEMNDEELSAKCAHAIGEGVMFYTGYDTEKSSRMCKLLKQEGQEPCLAAVREMHAGTHTH